MANKYCNLDGSKKIKDTYTDINEGFDKVEEDVNSINNRVDNIITTPVEGVSAQEIIDARGGRPVLGKRFEDIEVELDAHKAENRLLINLLESKKADKTEIVDFNRRIDEIITTPVDGDITQQEIIDARQGAASLGANLSTIKDSLNFKLINKIIGGDMTKSGIWGAVAGSTNNTYQYTENGLEITKNADGNAYVILQNGTALANHVYYVSGLIKSTVPYTSQRDVFIYLAGTNGQMKLGDVGTEWTRKSGLRIPTVDTSSYFMTLSPSADQPVGSTVTVKNIFALDLTEIFGAGNEPSLEEMDYLYDLIGWFDGEKTVGQFEIYKFLYELNKKLEAKVNTMLEEENTLPDYVEDDIKIINEKLVYNHGGDFTLAFMTDIHGKEEHYKYIAKLMENGYVDGLVINGDLGHSSNESSVTATKEYFMNHTKNLRDIKKGIYFTRGNHDGTDGTEGTKFTDLDFTNALIRPFIKENVHDNGYYYVDDDIHKIRMIFLNSSRDTASRMGFGLDQVAWFESVLNSTLDGWDVITISHHHLLSKFSTMPVPSRADEIVTAIQNFKTNKPNCNHIGHWFGHIHRDVLETVDGITYVSTNSSNGYPQADRINGTNSEYVMDFININTLARTVNILRMGYGEDRSFTY